MTGVTGWQVFGRYVHERFATLGRAHDAAARALFHDLRRGAVGVRDASHLGIARSSATRCRVRLRQGRRCPRLPMLAASSAACSRGTACSSSIRDMGRCNTPITRHPRGRQTHLPVAIGGAMIVLFAIEPSSRCVHGTEVEPAMELPILFAVVLPVPDRFGVPIAFALGISAAATMLYDALPLMPSCQRIASGIDGVLAAGDPVLHLRRRADAVRRHRRAAGPLRQARWSGTFAAASGLSTSGEHAVRRDFRVRRWPTPRRWARS